jgi:hypothetical protein
MSGRHHASVGHSMKGRPEVLPVGLAIMVFRYRLLQVRYEAEKYPPTCHTTY